MTTEHVSVPRTVEDVRNWHLHQLRTLKEAWQPYEHHKACAAILSRATPIDVCDFCGGDCSSANPPVATCPLITQGIDAAIDTVRKVDEATPSAPRVVTDADVERACSAYYGRGIYAKWENFDEFAKASQREYMRAALESFVNGDSNE